MPDKLQWLHRAIVDDDGPGVKRLVKEMPELARRMIRTARYETTIAHWIYTGDTALHLAAAGYRVEIAKTLLDAGADPGSAKNHRRGQPLHYAADGFLDNPSWDPQRQVAMIRLLLRAGADVQAQDKNGATPLHRAVRTRCAAAVACLLEAGSDATARNEAGSTPFHLAVQNTGRGGSGTAKAKLAQRDIIRLFLKKGTSLALRDRNGKSVVDWAQSEEIRQMLLAGAAGG